MKAAEKSSSLERPINAIAFGGACRTLRRDLSFLNIVEQTETSMKNDGENEVLFYDHAWYGWCVRQDGNVEVSSDEVWDGPFQWNRKAKKLGIRMKVLWTGTNADFFDVRDCDVVSKANEVLFIDPKESGFADFMTEERVETEGRDVDVVTLRDLQMKALALFHATPYLDWMIPTRQPQGAVDFFAENNRTVVAHRPMYRPDWIFPTDSDHREYEDAYNVSDEDDYLLVNLWVGLKARTQLELDGMSELLLRIRVPLIFLWLEPLLGPVDVTCVKHGAFSTVNLLDGVRNFGKIKTTCPGAPRVGWVIVGGDDDVLQPKPFDTEWLKQIVFQCSATGTALWVTSMGEKGMHEGSPLIFFATNPRDAGCWPDKYRIRMLPPVPKLPERGDRDA